MQNTAFSKSFQVYLMYINFNMYKAMYTGMFGIFFSGPVQEPKFNTHFICNTEHAIASL